MTIPWIYLVIIGGGWICITVAIFIILLLVYYRIYLNRLVNKSYLKITADGILECKYQGAAKVCYPIKEIKSIEEMSYEEACEKYAMEPVKLHYNPQLSLQPPEGVLIFFNRAWIKSVFPVFFNPEDIDGFISAIKQKMESPALPDIR